MGKSAARKAMSLQSDAADRYTKLAEDLNTEAKPARDLVGTYWKSIIGGGPEAYKAVGPQVSFVKRQFAQARNTVRDHVPNGGAKQRAYRDLAIAEPGQIGALFSSKIDEAIARLGNLANFSTEQTLAANSGIGSVGDSLARLSAMRAQAVASGLGGLASTIGIFTGMGGGNSNFKNLPGSIYTGDVRFPNA
jgi:hypothetical protein